MPRINSRVLAVRLLTKVYQRKQSLTKVFEDLTSHPEQSFIKELCFGTLRWFWRLDFFAKQLLKQPLKPKDDDIYMLILAGLYQITELNVPDYAAVAESVNAARELGKPWASKLVNAILRQFIRQQKSLIEQAKQNEVAHYAHPLWLIRKLQQHWPGEWQSIAKINNQRPPLSLRINRLRIERGDYLQLLAQHHIKAEVVTDAEQGIILATPLPISELPGFEEGYFTVQDISAQMAASLVQLKPGQRVLDACAAPGGKTGHLLELQPQLKQLVAVDNEPNRVTRIEDTLQRLGLSASVVCADVADVDSWWDRQLFDRILLDAPCSGTGVIRRHPDIKLLRQPSDIAQYTQQQLRLLRSLWSVLKPDGLLVYVTCSILPEENQQMIAQFLAEQPDASHKKIVAEWGLECNYGRQILPLKDRDGFYYVCLRKVL